MTANILNGKDLAAHIRDNLKLKINMIEKKPHLAIILAGEDPASRIYVRNKEKAAAETGIHTTLYSLPDNVQQQYIETLVEKLNNDPDTHGIMIQLPLPKHLDTSRILDLVNPDKDVDGFHPTNIGLLQNDNAAAVIAATPKGIMRMLDEQNIELSGKNALVIGRSQIVGKPIAMLLLNRDCTVTIAHSKTENLENLVKQADIVVAACGCPKLIKGEWIKEKAVIIDVGINRVDGKLCGDVDFDNAVDKASLITPVPGGIGPMTIAMLLENTFQAYLKQNNN